MTTSSSWLGSARSEPGALENVEAGCQVVRDHARPGRRRRDECEEARVIHARCERQHVLHDALEHCHRVPPLFRRRLPQQRFERRPRRAAPRLGAWRRPSMRATSSSVARCASCCIASADMPRPDVSTSLCFFIRLAERVRFELTKVPCDFAGFQDRCIQPLCHLSGGIRCGGDCRLRRRRPQVSRRAREARFAILLPGI